MFGTLRSNWQSAACGHACGAKTPNGGVCTAIERRQGSITRATNRELGVGRPAVDLAHRVWRVVRRERLAPVIANELNLRELAAPATTNASHELVRWTLLSETQSREAGRFH